MLVRCSIINHPKITLLFCFVDGQKIAKKLCEQISKEKRRIKLLMPDYNVCQTIHGQATIFARSMRPSGIVPSTAFISNNNTKRSSLNIFISIFLSIYMIPSLYLAVR